MSADAAFVGAVLAGGRSVRMGRDKAFVEIAGEPMVLHVGRALEAAGASEVHVIGGDRPRLAALGLGVVDDDHPGEGPVGGVLTALTHLSGTDGRPRDVLVVACDLPHLAGEDLRRLVDADGAHVDVLVARTDRVEPMCARWRRSALPALRDAFEAGERALHRVISRLPHTEVHLAAEALRNVNAPADIPTGNRPAAG